MDRSDSRGQESHGDNAKNMMKTSSSPSPSRRAVPRQLSEAPRMSSPMAGGRKEPVRSNSSRFDIPWQTQERKRRKSTGSICSEPERAASFSSARPKIARSQSRTMLESLMQPVHMMNPAGSYYVTDEGTRLPTIPKQGLRALRAEAEKKARRWFPCLKPEEPDGCPSIDEDEGARRITVGHWSPNDASLASEPLRDGPPATGPGVMLNKVTTAQYEPWNFLPKNLYKQFHRPQNVYFLFISILQTIGEISITAGVPSTLVPLIFVLFVTICKDGYEDWNRHKSDHEENSRLAHKVLVDEEDRARHRARGRRRRSLRRPSALEGGEEEEEEGGGGGEGGGDEEEGGAGTTVDIPWSQVQVGDVLTVRNREAVPADLVLMACSDPHGLAFVQTANLDGETNLKARHVPPALVGEGLRDIMEEARVTCDLPNNRLDAFKGTYAYRGGAGQARATEVAVGPKNVLLRGCRLCNSAWATGVVVYAGPEAKIQMNSAATPFKTSRLALFTNRETYNVLLLQIVLCFLGAVIGGAWAGQDRVAWGGYLWGPEGPDDDAALSGFLLFWSFILIFTNFVPISLLVTLDIVKFFQSLMMMWDLEMYHEAVDQEGNIKQIPMQVRCSDLNDELGLVDHVFSDKTGTLTCNVMEFRKCCVRGVGFGRGTTEIGRALLQARGLPVPEDPPATKRDRATPNVNFTDPDLWVALGDAGHALHGAARAFFLGLALNHDVMPELRAPKAPGAAPEVAYSASSPDEAALVYAARHFGFFFKAREADTVTVEVDGEERRFKLLHTLEFNSDRKRSSVVVEQDGDKVMYTKGADNVIRARLSRDPAANPAAALAATERLLDRYVDDGLRTLLVARRRMPPREYAAFAAELHAAETAVADREARVEAVADRAERGLELLGATAIEDKLQAGVPAALTALREGGVKVWMLTGDKVGTAINIGYSCSLLTPEAELLRLCAEDAADKGGMAKGPSGLPEEPDMQWKLEELRSELAHAPPGRTFALVVDTGALQALQDYGLEDQFLELCHACRSVVCARVSPKQKADVVRLVRRADPGAVTLGIGDGANDVPMIQTAHVGVGIHGLEGQQAVNSSDFSIGQFAFLRRLMLVHGRWNYRRLCLLVKYMFYKNAAIVLPQWFFGFRALFSGQALFFDYFYQLYNVAFTALPIIGLGVLDQDVSPKIIESFPVFYRDGLERVFLDRKIFWSWMLEAGIHSVIIFFMVAAAHGEGVWGAGEESTGLGLYEMGTTCLTIVIIFCQIRLFFETSNFTWIMALLYSGSIFLWWMCWITISNWVDLGYLVYGNIDVVARSGPFWLSLIFSCTFCFMITLIRQSTEVMLAPTRSHIGREVMAGHLDGEKLGREQAAAALAEQSQASGFGRARAKSSKEVLTEMLVGGNMVRASSQKRLAGAQAPPAAAAAGARRGEGGDEARSPSSSLRKANGAPAGGFDQEVKEERPETGLGQNPFNYLEKVFSKDRLIQQSGDGRGEGVDALRPTSPLKRAASRGPAKTSQSSSRQPFARPEARISASSRRSHSSARRAASETTEEEVDSGTPLAHQREKLKVEESSTIATSKGAGGGPGSEPSAGRAAPGSTPAAAGGPSSSRGGGGGLGWTPGYGGGPGSDRGSSSASSVASRGSSGASSRRRRPGRPLAKGAREGEEGGASERGSSLSSSSVGATKRRSASAGPRGASRPRGGRGQPPPVRETAGDVPILLKEKQNSIRMGAKMFSNSSNREVPAANKKSNSWRVGGFKLPSPGSKAGSDNLLSPNMPSARSTPSSTKNHRSPKKRRSPKSTSVRSTGFATREPEGLPRSIPEDQEVAEDQLPEVPEQVDSKGRTKIGADGMTSRQTSSLGMSSAASYSDEEDEDQDSELSSAFSSVSSAKSSNDYQQ